MCPEKVLIMSDSWLRYRNKVGVKFESEQKYKTGKKQ